MAECAYGRNLKIFLFDSTVSSSIMEKLHSYRAISNFSDASPTPAHPLIVVIRFQGIHNISDLTLLNEIVVFNHLLFGWLHNLHQRSCLPYEDSRKCS